MRQLKGFYPEEFVVKQVEEIRGVVGSERALIAVSGGVDSTASAALTHRAIGGNLLCVMLDDAFMRHMEPERVAHLLSQPPLNLPIKVLDVQQRFLDALKGLRDAEKKRKKFRETFYEILSEIAENEECRFLVQGTIQADIVETRGGIKTQHNVLTQIGISPTEKYGFHVVEPVASLYKGQVRKVAKYLGVPTEISERQPFPGPGLSVRVVGQINVEKVETLRKATEITEENLAKHSPSQYFAAILDNIEQPQHSSRVRITETAARYLNVPSRYLSVKVFQDKATGVKGGKRHYGEIAAITAETTDGRIHKAIVKDLVTLQTKAITENPSFTRIMYAIHKKPEKQPYVISLRAIQTLDFLTARVAEIPWTTLAETAENILEACPDVSAVYYDVTPKPPATIEME